MHSIDSVDWAEKLKSAKNVVKSFFENKFYALERTAYMIKNGERSQDGKKKYFDKPLTTRPLS